jgi:hypothetical protein
MSTIEKYLLQCQSHTFPIQYMGLPLSMKKPPRESFLPMYKNSYQTTCLQPTIRKRKKENSFGEKIKLSLGATR